MKTSVKSIFSLSVMFKVLTLILGACGGGTRDRHTDETKADTLYPEARLSPEIKT